jgi:hypothetical protein
MQQIMFFFIKWSRSQKFAQIYTKNSFFENEPLLERLAMDKRYALLGLLGH